MSQGPRVLRPQRDQVRWDLVDLDSQLPPDHRARLVWSFVERLGPQARLFLPEFCDALRNEVDPVRLNQVEAILNQFEPDARQQALPIIKERLRRERDKDVREILKKMLSSLEHR